MRRTLLRAVLVAVLVAGFGAAVWLTRGCVADEWAAADAVTLYSVDGRTPWQPNLGGGETLYDLPVLGKVEVGDAATRRRLARAYAAAVAGWPTPHNCFWPRHVVRVRRGDTTTDYVVCFECQTRMEYVNGVARYRATPGIDRSARPAFDAVLAAAGVPVAADH